jgi:hypothetical protein
MTRYSHQTALLVVLFTSRGVSPLLAAQSLEEAAESFSRHSNSPRLMKDLTVGASPERRPVEGVLNKLKAVERFLNKDDAAFLRAEFLSYFES